jgi:CRP/FNR family transcriptional regulator, cyclic AMP receptor protein
MPAKAHLTVTPKASENAPTPSIESVISQHPFLAGLSPHHLRLVCDCAMRAHFSADELIFKEGDPANRFYLIQKGRVALECYAKERGNTLIQIIGNGDVLGWSWLFPPYVWHFNARALEPTDAVFIYAAPLREGCESDQELGYELLKRMAEIMLTRLQATRRQLLRLSGRL